MLRPSPPDRRNEKYPGELKSHTKRKISKTQRLRGFRGRLILKVVLCFNSLTSDCTMFLKLGASLEILGIDFSCETP